MKGIKPLPYTFKFDIISNKDDNKRVYDDRYIQFYLDDKLYYRFISNRDISKNVIIFWKYSSHFNSSGEIIYTCIPNDLQYIKQIISEHWKNQNI